MSKKIMLLDPQFENEPLIMCFKNNDNYNIINSNQFVCDVPLKTALQIYNYILDDEKQIKIDNDVMVYLGKIGDKNG